MQRRNDGPTTIIIFNVVLGGALNGLLDLLKKLFRRRSGSSSPGVPTVWRGHFLHFCEKQFLNALAVVSCQRAFDVIAWNARAVFVSRQCRNADAYCRSYSFPASFAS